MHALVQSAAQAGTEPMPIWLIIAVGLAGVLVAVAVTFMRSIKDKRFVVFFILAATAVAIVLLLWQPYDPTTH